MSSASSPAVTSPVFVRRGPPPPPSSIPPTTSSSRRSRRSKRPAKRRRSVADAGTEIDRRAAPGPEAYDAPGQPKTRLGLIERDQLRVSRVAGLGELRGAVE